MEKTARLSSLELAVLTAIKQLPRGRVTTYKQIAKKIGRSKAARFVGQVLNKNPQLITIPCHRVVRADGGLGGYALGVRKKAKLLKQEGVLIKRGRIVNFRKIFYSR